MLEYLMFPSLYICFISIVNIFSTAINKPISINKNLISLYNISNSLLNLYVCVNLSEYVLNKNIGLYTKCDEKCIYFIYLHYLCKYLDFFDTIIMILKHKWIQVNFLQLFHHSTIGVVWFIVLKDAPTHSAMISSGAFANSFIHFLMYFHYFLANNGINNPFKSLMTLLQMSQFAICLSIGVFWCYHFPEYYMFGVNQIIYMCLMLLLFYYYVYKTKDVKLDSSPSCLNRAEIPDRNGGGALKKSVIIKINNNKYDVSNFIKNHPGGNIIENFDISIIPDATDVFNTFHFYSEYAPKLLKTMIIKDKDESSESLEISTKRVTESKSLQSKSENDFHLLITKWKKDGLFDKCLGKYTIYASVIFIIILSGFICLSLDYPILGSLIVGFGWGQAGFVQHNAGHLAVTGKPCIDYVIQSIFECLLKGGSARWWRNRHNKHHAMTNSIKYDGDLRTTPFFAWDDVLIKKVPTFLLRFQYLLYIPTLFLYVPVFFISTKLFIIRRKYWDELGLVFIHFYLSSFFYTNLYNYILFYTIGYVFQGFYLGIMFGLNHFTMTRIEDKNCKLDFFDWQLSTTCNWGGQNIFCRYMSGFLNLQIEHHLVPQMPFDNYIKIVDDVKNHALKHNIPYYDFSFLEAFYNMINELKIAGEKELILRTTNKTN